MMKKISSRQNPEVLSIVALADSKERQKQGKFIAEGLRACTTLIKSPVRLVQLYLLEEMVESVAGFVNANLITIVSEPVMAKISLATNSSGIVGVFHTPRNPDASQLQAGLVLANITDPGNMGTLIRTCVALNIKSVVVIQGTDPWSPKVVQATAGTIAHVDIFRWTWQELLANKGSMPVCSLVVSGGKVPSPEFKDTLLVVGNEAHGIPQGWLMNCDEQLTIPMPGNAESLNAAVATSIALYMTHSA